ncbi:glycoside hydrolase family 16 protein [Geminisphaera colitermitum]|uniref:glycoside hydrolase family 16 protein n=1 Tax=Geminisphaera colitermitum TaxID=1148786 RepID=UPI0002D95ECA|nr:glycoside hydrolase family 16 protein [Geminisphaera colitermitum]
MKHDSIFHSLHRALAITCLIVTPAAFAQTSIATAAATPPKNVTTVESFAALAFDTSQRGTPLDLSNYQRTFFDDFDTMSISPPGGEEATWYGPVHGGETRTRWLPPGPNGPFSIKDGNLVITATKPTATTPSAKWDSGIIESVDRNGRGFAQKYGYFEMRAQFPAGPGAWPAFWLKAAAERTNRTISRPEIDIVEWYGGDSRGHHASIHLWSSTRNRDPDYPLARHVWRSNYFDLRELTPPVLTPAENDRWGHLNGFHTYGAEVTPRHVIFYFDRKEISRFPTLPEYHQPLFMLVCLSILAKEADIAESPKQMLVDYVAAWQTKDPK